MFRRLAAHQPTPQLVPLVEPIERVVHVGAGDLAAGTTLTAPLDPLAAVRHAAEVLAAVGQVIDGMGGVSDPLEQQQLIHATANAGNLTRRLLERIERPVYDADASEAERLPPEALVTRDGDDALWRLVPLSATANERAGARPASSIPAPAVIMGRDAVFGWQRFTVQDGVMVRLQNCTVVVPKGREPFPEPIEWEYPGSWAKRVTVKDVEG